MPTYTGTFGIYNQTTPWTDTRSLSWSDLAALLTTHTVGIKEGTCLVPAVFSGTKRVKAEAKRIDVVFLDSDAGYALETIRAAITRHGWAAAIASTHSHLTTRTQAKRGNWDKFRAAAEAEDDPAALPERFLLEEKGYLPSSRTRPGLPREQTSTPCSSTGPARSSASRCRCPGPGWPAGMTTSVRPTRLEGAHRGAGRGARAQPRPGLHRHVAPVLPAAPIGGWTTRRNGGP